VRATLIGLSLESYSESLKVLQQFLFGVLCVTLLSLGFAENAVLAAHIFAAGALLVVTLFILQKRLLLSTVLKPVPREINRRDLFYFNIKNLLLILLTISLYHIDIIILGVLTNPESTGQYKAAAQVSEIIWMVPTAIATLFVHNTSSLWYDGDIESINHLTSKAVKYTLMLSLLMGGGLFLLADRFMPLYLGSEFSASVIPIQLLLPGVVCFSISQPIYSVGQAKGELKPLIVATFVSASLNFVLNVVLIPSLGLTGAAIATSVGYGSMLLFHYLSARKLGFRPFMNLSVSRIAFVTVVVYATLIAVDLVTPSPLLSLLIIPPVGLGVYLYLAFKLELIQDDEIQAVRSIFTENQ
jgi:O-antigen/teichoic acid export membrane protein